MSIKVVIAFHSGYGHTARQAAAVAAGMDSVDGAEAELRDVTVLGALAQSPSDLGPEVAPPPSDLRTAEHLGRRVAETAARLSLGAA